MDNHALQEIFNATRVLEEDMFDEDQEASLIVDYQSKDWVSFFDIIIEQVLKDKTFDFQKDLAIDQMIELLNKTRFRENYSRDNLILDLATTLYGFLKLLSHSNLRKTSS